MSKGFYLSLEALTSLALLGMLLAMPLQENKPGLENLHILKKENDLLTIWAKTWGEMDQARAIREFGFAFPKTGGAITLDGKKTEIGKQTGESVSSKAVFFDQHMQKHEITLVVFKPEPS